MPIWIASGLSPKLYFLSGRVLFLIVTSKNNISKISLLIFKTVCEKIIEYFLYNFIFGKPNEETFWHHQGIKAKIFIPSMFKFLPTVSSVQSILINNSVDLGGAPIVFQGSSCPIIKHKQITIRCLLSNEIIQVLIQQFVTSMCTKLTFGRQIKIVNNRSNPESPLAIMSFILQNKYWRAYFQRVFLT